MQHFNSKSNKTLTAKQAAIVASESYPKYLRAWAGTGKTEVLVQKIISILDREDTSLSNFGIITFTNKATEEMQKRISDMLYRKWLSKECIESDGFAKETELST